MPKIFELENPPPDFRTWEQEKQLSFLQEACHNFLKTLLEDLKAKEFIVLVQQMREITEQIDLGEQGRASAPTGRFQIDLVIQLTQLGFESFKKTVEKRKAKESPIILL